MNSLKHQDFQNPRRIRFWGAHSSGANRLAAASALALAVLGLALALASLLKSIGQEADLEQETRAAQGEIASLSPRAVVPSKPASPQDVERQARIIHQLNLPWADVLSTLEKLRPDGVAMVSMEPAGTGALRFQAESLSLDRLLAYAASLQATGPFGSLNYTRHETNDRDPNRPVRLTFEIALNARVPR